MIVYIDNEFKCHATNQEGCKPIDSPFFENKCDAFIEGYRFIPSGEVWTREDGMAFDGETIFPWKPWDTLDIAQRQYEHERYMKFLEEKESYMQAYAEGVQEA